MFNSSLTPIIEVKNLIIEVKAFVDLIFFTVHNCFNVITVQSLFYVLKNHPC